MRILVTGAAGFLGSHLCDRLLARGDWVLGLDNLSTGRRENIAHLEGNPAFRLVRQDVNDPLLVPGPLDCILHFASPASPADYLRMPIETLKVGSVGTLNLLELALTYRATFMLASTSEVYGDPLVHPQPESYWGNVNPVGQRSVYDEAKRFAEAMTMAYRRSHGLSVRIARIFNTYGPRMRSFDGRAIPAFIRQALRGEELTVFGDGRQTRSFCYVDDLVEGLLRLLGSNFEEPMNIGSQEEMPIVDLAHLIVKLTGAASRIAHLPLPQDDPQVRRPDLTRAREHLGWSPRIALAEGLPRTIEYFARLPDREERQ
jgi:dTDP-glucose 4,6-dehydratase